MLTCHFFSFVKKGRESHRENDMKQWRERTRWRRNLIEVKKIRKIEQKRNLRRQTTTQQINFSSKLDLFSDGGGAFSSHQIIGQSVKV